MLSEKWTTCGRCGKKPTKEADKVISFTIGDEVLCESCAPPKKEAIDCPAANKAEKLLLEAADLLRESLDVPFLSKREDWEQFCKYYRARANALLERISSSVPKD